MVFDEKWGVWVEEGGDYVVGKVREIRGGGMGEECVRGLGMEGSEGRLELIVGNVREEVGEGDDVVVRVREGGKSYVEVVERVEEMVWERFLNEGFVEMVVGGGDDGEIEGVVGVVRYRGVCGLVYGRE